MKFLRSFSSLLILATMALVLPIPKAQAQLTPLYVANFTIGTNLATIAASSTVTANSTAITIRKREGIAIMPSLSLAAANPGSATNITIYFEVSADGSNYTQNTTPAFNQVVGSNGTNVVNSVKFITPDQLDNVRYMRISAIQNGSTNVVTFNRIQYSYFN